jgi:hypothetical protein
MVLADGLSEFTDDGTGFSVEYPTRDRHAPEPRAVGLVA